MVGGFPLGCQVSPSIPMKQHTRTGPYGPSVFPLQVSSHERWWNGSECDSANCNEYIVPFMIGQWGLKPFGSKEKKSIYFVFAA